ncbi:integumentary mucin C.1-like [Ylistrum balloti]|uniref:integumentary mucin C.1-like n=1 Tax=Ylistrum balloti TaxID=509963 RepID=UPI002905B22A|nr:integumentary mucin C.1-like [Ylistrum balloti]
MDPLKLLVCVCFLLTGLSTPSETICSGESYEYNTSLTICYWLVLTEQSAQASEEQCIDEGGNLAYVPNQSALDTINTLRTNAGYQYTPEFYIGYKEYGSTVYVWDTNIEQNFKPWASGQPTSNTNECITVYNIDGTWWDEKCTTNYKAVCSDFGPRTGKSTTPQPTTTTTTTQQPTTTTTTTPQPTTTTTTTPQLTTTTTTTPQPTTTTTTMPTTTQQNCIPCSCYTNTTHNKTVEEFREEVRKTLLVDTSTLSSSIRKKTSASDPRPSAAAVGYLGVVLMTVVFGGILLMDAGNIIRCGKAIVKLTKKLLA